MRYYEMRFVTNRGRVLYGPIFKKDKYDKMQEVAYKISELKNLRMTLGKYALFIPQETLANGYIEIKPVGLIRTLIRTWRSR